MVSKTRFLDGNPIQFEPKPRKRVFGERGANFQFAFIEVL